MKTVAIGGAVFTLAIIGWPHGTSSERAGVSSPRSPTADTGTSATRSLGVSLAADAGTSGERVANAGRADGSAPTRSTRSLDVSTATTVTAPDLVDGKDASWWATRARSNGRTMRLRGLTLTGLRATLRSQVRLGASGLERAFLCIHRFEGSWRDPNPPYWGGVQMDWAFMAAYGPWFLRAFGPASNWTPAMQIATAERAYLSGRGFAPWPVTSRRCGLR